MSNEIEPLFSIIMPCYNMGRYVSSAIESVLLQTYRDWELIAVDDCGPDDGTDLIVRGLQKQNPDRKIRWIQLSENVGVSRARNQAVEASNGNFLAFLDPDDLWSSNHLQNCRLAFNCDPAIDLVCSPVRVFQGNEPLASASLWPFQRWQQEAFPYSLGLYNFIQPSGVCMRKTSFNSVGGFSLNPDLLHVEDFDLWIRLASNGCYFKFLDEPTCYYRQHDSAATADKAMFSKRMNALAEQHSEFLIASLRAVCTETVKRLENLENRQAGPVFQFLHRCDRFVGRIFSRNR